MKVGIVGYGIDIPRYRIKAQEIARVWGEEEKRITEGLGLTEKSVPGLDEDAATLAVQAARRAVKHAKINGTNVNAVYVGSESHPYAVKPTATIVAESIGATPDLYIADHEFACKAGTASMINAYALIKAEEVQYGMGIGTDTSQGRPGDALEYSAGAGAAAFLMGNKDYIAEIKGVYSYATDTPDFWRREHAIYPSHGGRFTGEPGYFKHVTGGATGMMKESGAEPKDYTYAVFHQPNGKFPKQIAKQLGFTNEQIKPGLVTPFIGNTYSAASMIGLAATLDIAKPGDRILVTSFGSGAGSDAFDIVVTDEIEKNRNEYTFERVTKNKTYIDYAAYVKHRKKLIL